MSKYDPLKNYLRQATESALTLKFVEIEQILGFDLPASAYKYASWWANSARGGAHMKSWRDAGWEVSKIDLSGRRVTFRRRSGQPVRPLSPRSSSPSTAEGTSALQAQANDAEGEAFQAAPVSVTPEVSNRVSTLPKGTEAAETVKTPAATVSVRREGVVRSTLVPEEAVDLAKLPGHARRLLESRAHLTGRTPAQEAAVALARVLTEERQRLVQRLAEIRGRTLRPGSFDLLAVLGRTRGGE